MALPNPYQRYKTQSVQSLSQKQLLLMMYKGVIKFLKKGILAIEKGDIEGAHVSLTKAGKIILELISTLKMEKAPELANNLKRLYVFCYEKIIKGNLEKNKDLVIEALEVIEPLAKIWEEILDTRKTVAPEGMPQFKKTYV